MSLTLYDITVATYIRLTEAALQVMQKGREHYSQNAMDVNSISDERLCGDMAPYSFQINSIRHHSLGAIKGIKAGSFSPPPPLDNTDFAFLEDLLSQSLEELNAFTPDEINALSGKDVMFSMGDFKIPFDTEGFLMSFSLPNFYFHTTTAYDILRMKGVPLSKRDFTGANARPMGI